MKQKTKILVVDDDANLRKTLADILKIKGYEIAVAASGTEAIAVAEREVFSLALIDLMLPDMPGLEVMARIKAIAPLTEVIILTGNASIDTAIEATRQGAYSYLLKPYQMDDLLLSIGHGVERQQAQETQKLFRALLDNSGDAIEVIDPVTLRFTDVNETECRDLGYSREELLSMSVSDIDPVISEDAKKMIGEQLRQSGSARFEGVHRRKDGSIFPVEINSTWVELDKPYLLNIVRDITERKQAEAALREKEQILSESQRIAHVGSWEWNAVNNTVMWSDETYRIFGLKPQQTVVTFEIYLQAVHPDDRQYVENNIRESLELARPYSMEHRILLPDCTVRYVQERIEAVRNDQGQLVKLHGTTQDITERKQAENSLRKLSLAVEQSPSSIIITDLDANIEYANAAFVKTTGYSLAEAIGQNPRLLHSGKNPKASYDDMWAHLTRGEEWEGEFINRRKDGSEYIESIWISPVRQPDGSITNYLAIKKDITELKQAEESLKNMATKYRTVFESSSDAIFLNDEIGFIDCNPAALRMFGSATRDEIIGKHPAQLSPSTQPSGEDSLSLAKEYIATAFKDGSMQFEWTHRRCDGSEFPAEVLLTAMKLDGKLVLQATARDITERKRAQAAEVRYRRLFESAKDGILILDAETGLVVDVNPFLTNLLGYSHEALLGKYIWDLSFLHNFVADQDRFLELQQQNYVRYEDLPLETAQGETIHVEFVSNVYLVGNTRVVQCDIRDITERNRLVETLLLNKNRLKEAQRIGKLGFLDWDLISNEIELSDETLRMCGLDPTRKKVAAEELIKLVHPDDAELVVKNLNDATEGDGVHEVEHRIVRPDGRAIYVHTSAEAFKDANGKPIRVLGTALDISELKLAQVALSHLNAELENKVAARTVDLEHARHDAEQANQAKSSFLASMSHEIRTPMNGVIGMLDVLQQSSLKGSQVEMVNIIHDSAFALLTIIDDILDFSKIEAGKFHIELLPMAIADVVEGACETLDRMAKKKEVELTLFTDPTIPAAVMGDPGRLRQILINLANNAIKFSCGQARPGKVSLRALLAESTPEQVTLEFRVTDNGIGIDEATQARLFTAFTQAETSTTRTYGGTGLGLAISRQLVNIMGGEIAIQSEPGKGSVFSVRLQFTLPTDVGRDSACVVGASAPYNHGVPLAGASRHVGSPKGYKNLSEVKSDLQKIDLQGLFCLVVGDAESLSDDLAVYLAHGGARVERVPDLAAAKAWIAGSQLGLCIMVIDHACGTLLDELRAVARAHPSLDVHFVVIGRGGRRQCRTEAVDVVTLDGESMHQRAFLQAVAIASGRATQPDWQAIPGEANATLTPLSREKARLQGSLILVAEDNEINQKVILQQLTLLGKTADIASNGREALEFWQRGDYAILLTDLHMPEMDGYGLTAAIRAAETNQVHIPIIAFTANALKGEAEHCRSVGMDDYLSKPVQLVTLKAMLEKWLPISAEEPTQPRSPHDNAGSTPGLHPGYMAPASIPVDVNVLKALIGDDEATIRDFLHDFHHSAVKIAVELRTACAAGQAATAAALTHKLKSSARAVGALVLGELCAEMEKSGKEGDNEALTLLLPKFEQELARVEHFLEGY